MGPLKKCTKIWCNFCLLLFLSNLLLHFPKKGPKRCFSFETGPICKAADWSKGKHKYICEIVPGFGGGKILFICLCGFIPYGGEKHINIPPLPKILAQSREYTFLRYFSSFICFAPKIWLPQTCAYTDVTMYLVKALSWDTGSGRYTKYLLCSRYRFLGIRMLFA